MTFQERFSSCCDRNFTLLLWAILLAAFGVRMIALWSLQQTPYINSLVIDEAVYHGWATQIASGNYQPQAAYEFSPLPVYLMALVYKLFSPDVYYIRILNISLGVLTCLFIGLSARDLGGYRAGLAAALIAAFYKSFILYSIVPLKTSLSVLMMAIQVYLLLQLLARPTAVYAALLGVFGALAFNVRGNYAALIPVFLAAIGWTGLQLRTTRLQISQLILAFCGGLFLVMVPFALRNYQITNEFILSTTQAGFNLYLGNNLDSPVPYYYPVSFASTVPFEQGKEFTIEASRRAGKALTAKQASSYWAGQVYRYAGQQPLAFLRKLGQKTLALLNRFEASDHYDTTFLSQFMPIFRLPLFGFTLIWPLGLAGLLASSLDNTRPRWLAATAFAYVATLILTFINGRYRLPLLAVVIPFAPVGLRQAVVYWREGHTGRLCFFVLSLCCFAILLFTPIRGANDMSLYYNLHGNILQQAKRQGEAIDFWQKSAELNGTFSDSAKLALAAASYRKGDLPMAKRYLQQIADQSYAAARRYALTGDILLAEGNWREAADAYEKSLTINTSQDEVRRKLLSLLDTLDPSGAHRQYLQRAGILAFDKGL